MSFSRLHITVFLAIAVIVWASLLLLRGIPISAGHLAPFGAVVGSLVLAAVFFDRILWRQRWLHAWFVKRPDLRGTWRVELQSDWTDPEAGETAALTVCYMGVEQTLSKLQVHLMTRESESWIVADKIRPSPNGTGYEVIGVYTNTPKLHLRGDRSEMHRGALVLHTHGPAATPDTLTGEYWTDRGTAGSMTFIGRLPRLHTRYEDAHEGFLLDDS